MLFAQANSIRTRSNAVLMPDDDGFLDVTESRVATTSMELGSPYLMDFSEPSQPPVRRQLSGSQSNFKSMMHDLQTNNQLLTSQDPRLFPGLNKMTTEEADAADIAAGKPVITQTAR
eukprot:g3430.t1